MLNKLMKNKKGFTLIELIVVIAILGILAAVLVPSIGNYVNKSKEGVALSEAAAFRSAAHLAKVEASLETGGFTQTGFEAIMTKSGYGSAQYSYSDLTWDTTNTNILKTAKYTASNGIVCNYASNAWTTA